MRVLKFGGTSIANAHKIVRVAEIIENSLCTSPVAVVLSAPEHITNYLVSLISDTLLDQRIKFDLISLENIFTQLGTELSKLQLNYDLKKIQKILHRELIILIKILHGITFLGQCTENLQAAFICRGEQLAVAYMTVLLQARGHKVAIINPLDKLVADEGNYLEATIDIAISSKLIMDVRIPINHIVLMAGFTAGNEKRDPVILGRNGSDYSAAVLAACLHAQCCEIWTDVDGIYTIDPHHLNGAQQLQYLSYQEAMELSYFGAQVLHPRTIQPIAQFKIPCIIKNTTNPQASGTIISNNIRNNKIKGITQLNNIAMLNISGPVMTESMGEITARIFAVMSQASISVVLITQSSSEYSISLCITQNEQRKARKALEETFFLELKEGVIDQIKIMKDLAIITVVGDGMRTTYGRACKIFSALSHANINIIAISQGSSERSISVVVKNVQAIIGLKIVHQMLFNNNFQVIDAVIIGIGGIGSALLNQIERQQLLLRNKKIDLRVCMIANSKKILFKTEGINLKKWKNFWDQCQDDFKLDILFNLVKEATLINPVIIDCTSSQKIANQYVNFINHGFHIVTLNNEANSCSYKYYKLLRRICLKKNRKFYYDTNVVYGLPVIENLQNLINAGDKLIRFCGILSGSLSFIFGKLEVGISFSKATYIASQMGFTEPDPREDLSWRDVSRKLLILAREAGYKLELSDIKIEPLLPDKLNLIENRALFMLHLCVVDDYFSARVSEARAQNKILRPVALIEKNGSCRIQIVAVDEDNPIYEVKEGENILAFYTNYYQPRPLVLRGYGAGPDVTAARVFADILRTLIAPPGF
ncbi:MAG: bifunctional aspartate kinase/homoserine dehydrogenase I [Candidatus Dasytiphilus stammeri]